jgi:hypothetical protein
MDELLKHKDEAGAIGDLARELIVIMTEFKNGELSLEEKNELVTEVIDIYKAHDTADAEIVTRFAVQITENLLSVV